MTQVLVSNIKFTEEWSKEDFRKVKSAIFHHFGKKVIKTHHGNYQPAYRPFTEIDRIFGLAYTSSGMYACYSVCNTEVYSNEYAGYSYRMFAISKGGKVCGILWDNEENEIIIEL